MAPSATETVTLPTRAVEDPKVKLTSNTGPYKELAPIGYEKEAEEQGRDGFQAAKVCASLVPIPRDIKQSISTKTTSQLGAMKSTLHSSHLNTMTLVSTQIQATPNSSQRVSPQPTLLRQSVQK